MAKDRVIIMGAAGRDFHNFNAYFRGNEAYEVVAFTATQIPNIEGRIYPPDLAGPEYATGIPIYSEARLTELIKELEVAQVIFAYSDISHEYVMHKASQVLAAGADFRLMGTGSTMLKAQKPVVSVCAVRTGSGKSQTTRRVCDILRERGKMVVVVRHPMPYGDLRKQICQRFASFEDLDRYECTIEEREEYEPHLDRGVVVYASDHGLLLESVKQMGFYSDACGDCHWSLPTSVIDQELAETMVSVARIVVSPEPGAMSTEAELELWVRHMRPVWKQSVEEMKLALLKCYVEAKEKGILSGERSPEDMAKFLGFE